MTDTKSKTVEHLTPRQVLGAHWIDGMTESGKPDERRVAAVKVGAKKDGRGKGGNISATLSPASVKAGALKGGIVKQM